MSFALLALLLVGFLIWAIAWPHVRLSRQARRIAALERRVAAAETALLAALGSAAPTQAQRPAPEAEARVETPAAARPEAPAEASAAPAQAAPDEKADARAAAPDWRAQWPGAAAARPAAPAQSLEERLGAKWSVLVGGAALALGALLLVRYTIEAGLLGPGARVIGGLLLGAALIAGGEATRRRDMPAFGRVSIPATLTAAGTAAIFAAIYAAHALYHFIAPATAFLLLGATGLATMSAAALHGPILAGLGLIGSFVTPVLVDSRAPAPWTLAIYLLIVTAAAYGVARMRRIFALGVAALAGAAAWQVLLLLDGGRGFETPALVHGLAQTALAVAVFVRPHVGSAAHPRAAASATLAPLAVAAATLLTLLSWPGGTSVAAHVAGGVGLVALAAAGGAWASVAAPLTAAAGLIALTTALGWPAFDAAAQAFRTPWDVVWTPPHDPRAFRLYAALAAGAVAAVAFGRLARVSTSPLPAAIYGAAGSATPVLMLALAYARVTALDVSGPFAMAAGALAVGFVSVAAAFRARAEDDAQARQGLGFAALGAFGALAVGLAAGLSGGSLTAAWGLTALAAAWLSARLDLVALRWGVVAAGALVALRLGWEPQVAREIGATPIFNWLLIGYGVPALAFAGAAALMRGREDLPLQVARAAAITLAGFLVFLEIRHALNGGDIYARASRLAETGLQAFSAMMFAIALTKIGGPNPPLVYRAATGIAGALSAVAVAFGLFVHANPLFTGDDIGEGRFANALIPGYLLPALGATALAVVARSMSPQRAQIAAGAALALIFAYASLQTRALFQGSLIGMGRGVGEAEATSYSAAWLALGLATLAYGVARRSKEARLGSSLFVLLATFKIFLYDFAGLTGAWRAFSFIGLGLVLIGIGAVYQRILFPRGPATPADGAAPPAV